MQAGSGRGITFRENRIEMEKIMQELHCSEPGLTELQTMTDLTEVVTDLCKRLAVLEARLIRKRPETKGRRMTRLDRCPFGWKPHPKNPLLLTEDWNEQETIRFMLDAQKHRGLGLRALCRYLDSLGLKRRGKQWAGAHSLVGSILERAN
jgi:hypothetical protein